MVTLAKKKKKIFQITLSLSRQDHKGKLTTIPDDLTDKGRLTTRTEDLTDKGKLTTDKSRSRVFH